MIICGIMNNRAISGEYFLHYGKKPGFYCRRKLKEISNSMLIFFRKESKIWRKEVKGKCKEI